MYVMSRNHKPTSENRERVVQLLTWIIRGTNILAHLRLTWVPSLFSSSDLTLSVCPFSFISLAHVRGSHTLRTWRKKNKSMKWRQCESIAVRKRLRMSDINNKGLKISGNIVKIIYCVTSWKLNVLRSLMSNLFSGSRHYNRPHLIHGQTVDGVLVPAERRRCTK